MRPGELEEWAEQEVLGTPGAKIVVRTRTVSLAAFESAARRTSAGVLFGVAALLRDARGRVLLVRGADEHAWSQGRWMVPGGGAERGEDPWQAVRREVWEETGTRARSLELWKAYREEVRSPSGGRLQWWFFQFVGDATPRPRPRSRVPEEIAEVRWFRRLPSELHFREDWLRPPRRNLRREGPLTRTVAGSAPGRARGPGRASR